MRRLIASLVAVAMFSGVAMVLESAPASAATPAPAAGAASTASRTCPAPIPNYFVPPAIYSAAVYVGCVAYLNLQSDTVGYYHDDYHIVLPNNLVAIQEFYIITHEYHGLTLKQQASVRNLWVNFFWQGYLQFLYTQTYFWNLVALYTAFFRAYAIGEITMIVCTTITAPLPGQLGAVAGPACGAAVDGYLSNT